MLLVDTLYTKAYATSGKLDVHLPVKVNAVNPAPRSLSTSCPAAPQTCSVDFVISCQSNGTRKEICLDRAANHLQIHTSCVSPASRASPGDSSGIGQSCSRMDRRGVRS